MGRKHFVKSNGHILVVMIMLVNVFSLFAQPAPYVMTFFIRPLSSSPKKVKHAYLEQKIKKPGKATKSIAKKHFARQYTTHGIFVSYWGYLAISDVNGQVIFPRKTTKLTIPLLVTTTIQPVPVSLQKPHLLRGFIINTKAPYQYYQLTGTEEKIPAQIQWQAKPVEMQKQLISPETIIIFANPKTIIVPTTATTIKNGNLVLPDVYATKNLDITGEVLKLFKLKHFFKPIEKTFNFQAEQYQERIEQ